jgi:hypothetical protein
MKNTPNISNRAECKIRGELHMRLHKAWIDIHIIIACNILAYFFRSGFPKNKFYHKPDFRGDIKPPLAAEKVIYLVFNIITEFSIIN